MKTITETLSTPVWGEYDLIVAGGGVGGICAAVSAKRNGVQRVLILEKSVLFGGLATLGLISWYEPLCDGRGHKLMYGMAEELLQLAIRYGPDCLPSEWRSNPDTADTEKRYATHFSPSILALALDEYIRDHGIDILLDTQAVRPIMDGNTCAGIIVENKTGRGAYLAGVVIDGTGDADILTRAGLPCEEGKNFLTYVAYRADTETARKAAEDGNMLRLRVWQTIGSDLFGKGHPQDAPMLAGVTAEDVTRFVLDGRRKLWEHIRGEDRHTRDITALPGMAQFRKTRRIIGAYTLTESDEGKRFADSIALAGDFTYAGKWYEIPYRLLYHPEYGNLLTVGRSVSASGWAWDVVRVIPVAAVTGQAAGAAAALCLQKDVSAKDVPVEALQQRLLDAGVHLHME